MIPFPKTKKKREPSFSKIDLSKFEYKLLKKLNLNECKNTIQEQQQKDFTVGSAWSGINSQQNNIPQFCFGTENGLLVRFIINNQFKTKDSKQNSSQSISIQQQKSINPVEILKKDTFIFQNNKLNDNQPYELNMEIFKIIDQKIPSPSYQVGQIQNCIIISHKEDNIYKLKIYDNNFIQFKELQSTVTQYIFTRTIHNLLIYRDINKCSSLPSLLFCKISKQNRNEFKLLSKINFDKAKLTPTTMLTYKDFLFVGVFQKQIYMYSIKKRKLIRIINPDTKSYPKKIIYSKNSGTIAVVSKNDQIVFINTFDGSIYCSSDLYNIFEQTDLEYNQSYEIYLFQFLSPDIVVIGGSFPYLLFFDWKSEKITHIYKDENNFVGMIIYNNLLILSHDKNSQMSIIQ